MIKLSYVNYWDRSLNDEQDNYFVKFIKNNIGEVKIVGYNEKPDILLCTVYGNINRAKNIKAKVKIFFYGENLERYPPYNNLKLLKSVFDIILGFKYTNKNEKIFRFPLWLCYYPYYNMNNKDDNVITHLENLYEENIKIKKKNLCSLIARHDRNGNRTILLNEVKKYGKVMCPSKFNNNCKGIDKGNKAKINFVKNSVYNICPENSRWEGYFTEKIFQALESGSIPIYTAIDKPEKDILNENKYCFIKNITDKNEVSNKIKDVIENRYKYLEGKLFKEESREIIGKYYDDLISELKRLLFR